ncbi:D-alanyl-lipoteichoic acid acyltransferase DltB, MBOAT superfamily [Prosthecobacter debontii]|uniref:D-alanyl-lipoteichoic acid acyltransferase DltB, MBOAT superfamily n=1 Tax=Prosthecobacter debontii TaxID=48467 RepID=A0A1T4YKU9_9BACT|nr:MBOAT family O-acyltransferase [Prosthecobacter debontii]SKB02313.1 D-alanyl-lipoteichoic acid acyltransferase DltB, MBOAT superfamily [Prosthecobacter debontii]
MWFNSFGFWLFFGLVVLIYSRLRLAGQNRWLLAASYFFYGCFDWRFLSLILFCTVLNYHAGIKIAASEDERHRKFWIGWSIVISLIVLGIFKYLGFFTHELSALLQSFGVIDTPWVLHLMLPAGISFFTFHALSYTIDVYRRDTPVCRSFVEFALFISFFPQLVAGPINRSTLLLPQMGKPRPPCDAARFKEGLYLVMSGLFLKVVVADNMAWLAGHVFSSSPESLGGLEVLLGVYAFAFQIYGDFAGYSSIACGTACWLGFDLAVNFRRPYFAISPQDFWQRWHISLSTWLRDYLYIPLGGNRQGSLMTYRNLMLTMLLGGLWHGAAWTFVVWGGIHGLWLAVHRALGGGRRKDAPDSVGLVLVKWLVTFHLVCLTWLVFRAETFAQAWGLMLRLGSDWSWTAYAQTSLSLIGFFLLPWLVYEAWVERRKDDYALLKTPWVWRAALYVYLTLMMLFFPPPVPAEFIYFRF